MKKFVLLSGILGLMGLVPPTGGFAQDKPPTFPSTSFMGGVPLGGGKPCFGIFGMAGCLGCPTPPQPTAPQQFYTGWTKFPDRGYFHRNLYVPRRSGYAELTLVFYPERPGFLFFFDPEEKVFLGKFRLGARPEQSFSLLLPLDRKGSLREIPDRVYRQWGPLPRISDLGFPWSHAPVRRPPENLPGDALPPDETLGPKD